MARYRSWSVSLTVPSKLAHSCSIASTLAPTSSVPIAAIALAMVVGSLVIPAITTAGSTLMSSGDTCASVVDDDLSSSEHADRPANVTTARPATPSRNAREVKLDVEGPTSAFRIGYRVITTPDLLC